MNEHDVVDNMTEEAGEENNLLLEHLELIEALAAIAAESEEAETVRISLGALARDPMGTVWLRQHKGGI